MLLRSQAPGMGTADFRGLPDNESSGMPNDYMTCCIHRIHSHIASLHALLGRAWVGRFGVWRRSRIHHAYSDTASLRGLGGCALLGCFDFWWSTRIHRAYTRIAPLCGLFRRVLSGWL